MDATDPAEFSPAIKLYTREFYQLAFRKLRDNGILVTQSSSPAHTLKLSLSILKTIESVFPRASIYSVYVKSFASIWSFSIGSKGPQPLTLSSEEVDRRLKERNVRGLRFYSIQAMSMKPSSSSQRRSLGIGGLSPSASPMRSP